MTLQVDGLYTFWPQIPSHSSGIHNPSDACAASAFDEAYVAVL